MRVLLTFLIVTLFSCNSDAQVNTPVKWDFTATKKSDKLYDVIITATLPQPWHIYSQLTPDGGPIPTKFTFKTNPLITVSGLPKEVGKLKTTHDENFGIDVKYYGDKVVFVQPVTVKANVKTNLTGTIEYMVCNDEKCLPPTKQNFEIRLQ